MPVKEANEDGLHELGGQFDISTAMPIEQPPAHLTRTVPRPPENPTWNFIKAVPGEVGKGVIEMGAEVIDQAHDLLQIPAAVAGVDHFPWKSDLVTKTMPAIGEWSQTPLKTIRIPEITLGSKGELIPTSMEYDVSPLDVAVGALMVFQAGAQFKYGMDANQYNKALVENIRSASMKAAVKENLPAFEKILFDAGVKIPKGMSVEDKVNIILSQAEQSPTLKGAVQNLAAGYKPLNAPLTEPIAPGKPATTAAPPAEPLPPSKQLDLAERARELHAELKSPKVGEVVAFEGKDGVIRTGKIREMQGNRAIIDLEGKKIVAPAKQLAAVPVTPKEPWEMTREEFEQAKASKLPEIEAEPPLPATIEGEGVSEPKNDLHGEYLRLKSELEASQTRPENAPEVGMAKELWGDLATGPKAGGMTRDREIPEQITKWLEKGVTVNERGAAIRIVEPEAKIKDISGKMVDLPKGHEMTPYKLSNGKIWLHDGKDVIVEPGQLTNLANKNIQLGGYESFAPEMAQIKEVVKGVEAGKKNLKDLTKGEISEIEVGKSGKFTIIDSNTGSRVISDGEYTFEEAAKLQTKLERQNPNDEFIVLPLGNKQQSLTLTPAIKARVIGQPMAGGMVPSPKGEHYEAVKKALAEGKMVPANVLRDYPDLQPGKTEVKTSGLAQGIEDELGRELGDLPTYRTRNMKDVAKRASEFIAKDPDLAMSIALGTAPEQEDLRAQELFTALRVKAKTEHDFVTMRDMALSDKASAMAVELGQRVKAYDTQDPEDPITAMREVSKAREGVAQRRMKTKDIQGVKKKDIEQAKKEIKKLSPTKETWADFIKSLEC